MSQLDEIKNIFESEAKYYTSVYIQLFQKKKDQLYQNILFNKYTKLN